jgi:hypothetical protein
MILGTTLKNQNYKNAEIEKILNAEDACYRLVKKFFLPVCNLRNKG